MLPQGDDPLNDQTIVDSPAQSNNTLHPSHCQQQEQEQPPILSPTSSTPPLVNPITTTLSPLEDIPLTFCSRPPLSFRFPSPGSPGAEHDETIIRMMDNEQSWGDIEALAGEDAFDRYYLFLDPGLEEFWTQDKIEQLNDAVIDHVGRFLKPRAATILKGTQHHHQQWHSKNSNTKGYNDSEGEDVKKMVTIYPVVVMSAWMDLCRWEKVARSVSSSPLVCQHIWETFGDGRPFTEKEQPFLDEIKAVAIENGARISAIKDAVARVETVKAKAAQEEADRLEAARIKAAKEEEEKIEAARIKAAQDEADRIEAEKLEAEKIKAAEVETKRVEANKIKAMKRKAKADAAREEAEKEAKARKAAKMKSGESRAAKEAARAEVTRRHTSMEVNEDALGTSKAKRETALAAAKAWEIAVREMAARKAEIQSVATKRQRSVSKGHAGLDQYQGLPLSPRGNLGNKRKIGNMEVFLPPATFNSATTGNTATTSADRENRSPQQNTIIPPPTLRTSTSSTSCSTLISPAPSPLDESFDFQLSKHIRRRSSSETLSGPTATSTEKTSTTPTPTIAIKSSINITPTPAPLLSDNHDTTPKAPSFGLPSCPPTSLSLDSEAQQRIQKLTKMKKVLTDCSQFMGLQCQDQRVKTDMLLRQRDAAIEAAKARQRGHSNNTSSHHKDNSTKSYQDSPESLTPAFFNAPQESIPVSTSLPSPVTPNQPPVSLSPKLPAAAPKTTSPPVIDLTEDADYDLSIAASAAQHQSPPQKDHWPQQLLPIRQQQQNSQQILQVQQHHQQQYLVQQQQQHYHILQHPRPTKSLGQPAQPVQSSTPQVTLNHQQTQEFLQEQIRKSPERYKLHQRHVFEKEQLLKQQQLDRQRLAQEQQLVAVQLQGIQGHKDEQLRLEVVNRWRQREQVWLKRVQTIHQQKQALGLTLAGHRQQIQHIRQAILSEQKQLQLQPSVTPEQIKRIHTNQRIQLATSQQQRYTALQFVPVAQQALAMTNLNQLCQTEARVLLTQQKDAEEKVDQFLHRQEGSKKAVQWLQLQLHQIQEAEKAVVKKLEGLHAQKQEQELRRAVLLQEHQVLQQGLQMIPVPSSSSSSSSPIQQGLMAGQGTAPVNLASSQQQQQQQQDQLVKEKYMMDEQLRQQLFQQRDIQRKQQLQDQVDLQQDQKSALLQHARTIAKFHLQGLTQSSSQDQSGQTWSGVQAQAQQQQQVQQQQAQTVTAQEQQVTMDCRSTSTFPNPLNQPSATKSISQPLRLALVVQDPPQPQPVSPPLQALETAEPQQSTPALHLSQPSTSGTASTSAPPTIQQHQPSPGSTTAATKLAAIFPFPNPLYDITEWTAEDKNRLWTTWLEVGDDWEQISAKGLRGKFSVEACRAVILGTAS
ncbi:MAG: hypothetical protein JOS17DRAFT_787071 [Linnemannia elongata]|nr:MAG: hypothetical protein JOS17DRAFT_787071 [Linnemannia elongata]